LIYQAQFFETKRWWWRV